MGTTSPSSVASGPLKDGHEDTSLLEGSSVRRRRSRAFSPPHYFLVVLLLCLIPLLNTIRSFDIPLRSWMVALRSGRLSGRVETGTEPLVLQNHKRDTGVDIGSLRMQPNAAGENSKLKRSLATLASFSSSNDHQSASELVLSDLVQRNVRQKAASKQRRYNISDQGTHILDVFYYDVKDPFFGDLVSSGLSEQETQELLNEVDKIWTVASKNVIKLRFNRRNIVLDQDRAAAFLFYVVGNPRVSGTRPATQEWLMKALGKDVERLQVPLRHVYKSSALIQMIERALFTARDSSELPTVTRTEYIEMVRQAMQSQPESSVASSSSKTMRHHHQPPSPGSQATQELVNPETLHDAFDGLIGASDGKDGWVITPESFKDFASVKDRAQQIKDVHLAFRLLYVRHVGLSMERVMEFAEANRDRPMLFMQYAIGRDTDLKTHSVNRPKWEFANTLSIYPVPFYHDLNGRGSQNWMDVIFRTGSCWDQGNNRRSNLNKHVIINGKDFGPIPCRWGVRKWEQHEYSSKELGRMVAHEIGHCVGLHHVQPHCIVYPSIAKANLMQQQRNIGLKEWRGKCSCLASSPSCGECFCPWDDDNFRRVGEARYLDDDQIETALGEVRRRDYLETPVRPLFSRIGPRFADHPVNSTVLLDAGDVIILLVDEGKSIATTRKVNQLHVRARLKGGSLSTVLTDRFKLWAYSGREGNCKGVHKTKGDAKWRDLHRETILPQSLFTANAHFEWPDLKDVELRPGESLAIEFAPSDVNTKVSIAVSGAEITTTMQHRSRVCLLRKNGPREGEGVTFLQDRALLLNYDSRIIGDN